MMAHDPNRSAGAGFSSDTLDLLHRALVAFLHDSSDESLRPALRQLGQEARQNGVPPEGVLIQLKQQWYALPSNGAAPDSVDRLRTLEHIVTMCIKEYFR